MGRLGFGNPALAWGALAIAVPIAIHLLSRRRSKKIAFAAVEFILRSKKQKTTNIRLRQLLLLAMRALIVGAIGLAIARPLIKPKVAASSTAGQRAATAIVLDGSLSMRYQLGGATLFERSRDEAKSLIDGLNAESPATLVVCDGTAPEVNPPDFDRVALRQKLNAAQPTYRAADVTACIGAAARALGQSPIEGKRVYVLGDLTAASLRLDAPPPKVPTPAGEVIPEVVFIDAAQGSDLPNLAVIDVSTAPSAALGTRGFDVTATIRNSGSKPVQGAPLSLEVGGRVVTRGFVDVPANGTARKLLAHRFEPGTQLATVRLEPDALPEDDARAFILRVPRDVRALVADGSPSAIRYKDETFFVEAALGPGRTGGRIEATFLDADAAQARSLQDFDVVLLLNVAAPKPAFVQALKPFVENGGGLFISMGDQVNVDDWNAAMGPLLPRPLHLLRTAADPDEPGPTPPARFSRIDFTHPAFAIFEGASEGFDSARVFRYVLLQTDTQKEERVLATLDDGSPALIEARRGQGRVILYTSTVDRDWSDWAIRTSFLPAIQQLTAYLAGGLDEKPPAISKVGETRALELPENTTLAEVKGPDDKPVKAGDEGVPTALPGHYRVSVRDGQGTRDLPQLSFVAVLDPKESDTKRVDANELASHFGGEDHTQIATGADGALPKSGTPLWNWLLLAAVIAFVGEGFLVRRA